jgi:hypothetical protein
MSLADAKIIAWRVAGTEQMAQLMGKGKAPS